MSRLFLDLDGVMADYDGHFPATFGLDHRDMTKKEMWQHIKTKDDFFITMPECDGALEFLFAIEHLHPVILTACPASQYESVAKQKRRWVQEHLGLHVPVLPVCGSESKPLFMHSPGDILIDDWGKNIAAWREAGGVGIKHETFPQTLSELFEVMLYERY